MRQTTSLTRWQRWRQALPFGVSLGLLEAVIFGIGIAYWSRLLPQQPVVIGLPLYLVIPAVAGYHFCWQRRHEGWESCWAGLRVGLVACVVFLVVTAINFAVALIIADNTPPPPSPSNPREIYSPGLALVIDMIIFGFLALLSSLSLFLSAAGGRIGGALAVWRAKRLQLQGQ